MENAQQKRHIPIIAGAVAQVGIGYLYIWGIFQPYVLKQLQIDATSASLVFSFALVFFVFGNIAGGKMQTFMKLGNVCLIGGLMMGIGISISMFAPTGCYMFLYATYGVIAGTGSGITYNAVIACNQRWFPDKLGLATGIAVATPGIGGLIFAPMLEKILSSAGVSAAYVTLGLLIFVLCTVSSFFIYSPPEGFVPEGYVPDKKEGAVKEYTVSELVRTPVFYALVFSMFLALPANMMILPLIKDIGAERGLSVSTAVLGVSLASFFNSFGRLVFPWVSDAIGRKKTLLLDFVITIVSVCGLVFVKGYLALILIIMVSFCYGGYLGIYPAITSGFFGMKNAGMNYGIVLTGFAGASIAAPYVAGIIKASGAGYGVSFAIAAAAAVFGLIIAAFIKKPTGE